MTLLLTPIQSNSPLFQLKFDFVAFSQVER